MGEVIPIKSRITASDLRKAMQEADPIFAAMMQPIKNDVTVLMLESEVDQMAELILSMFRQGCMGVDGKFDHDHISAWEEAQDWLIEHELIKPEQCRYE